jgi:hypothetical protein
MYRPKAGLVAITLGQPHSADIAHSRIHSAEDGRSNYERHASENLPTCLDRFLFFSFFLFFYKQTLQLTPLAAKEGNIVTLLDGAQFPLLSSRAGRLSKFRSRTYLTITFSAKRRPTSISQIYCFHSFLSPLKISPSFLFLFHQPSSIHNSFSSFLPPFKS